MMTRSEVRRRVVEILSTVPDWTQSGQSYDRFLSGAEEDFHRKFAVRVNGSVPLANETQRPEMGMMVKTTISVRVGYELRSPPDTIEDEDLADDAVHALVKAVTAQRRLPGFLELKHLSIDPPVTDQTEGRWWLGGFQLSAAHRLALE